MCLYGCWMFDNGCSMLLQMFVDGFPLCSTMLPCFPWSSKSLRSARRLRVQRVPNIITQVDVKFVCNTIMDNPVKHKFQTRCSNTYSNACIHRKCSTQIPNTFQNQMFKTNVQHTCSKYLKHFSKHLSNTIQTTLYDFCLGDPRGPMRSHRHTWFS